MGNSNEPLQTNNVEFLARNNGFKNLLSWYFQWPHPAINRWMNALRGKCRCNKKGASGVRKHPWKGAPASTRLGGSRPCVNPEASLEMPEAALNEEINKCVKSKRQHNEGKVFFFSFFSRKFAFLRFFSPYL